MKTKPFMINSCGVVHCSPLWRWDTSKVRFDDYDLWAVFKGKGELIVNGEKFMIEAGDCFLLPPKCSILGVNSAQDPLMTINVHFNFLKDGNPVYNLPLLKRRINDNYFYKKVLERVVTSFYQNSNNDAVFWLEVALKEFFSSEDVEDKSITHAHTVCVEKMCNRMNESFGKETSLESFAEEFRYSPSYLGRLFHKITGVSFSQYRINAKLNQAKLLLRTMDMTVSEISERLGYYDAGHFIKQFKSYVEVTPEEYRKSSRNK